MSAAAVVPNDTENTNLINRVRNSNDSIPNHQMRPLQMIKEANNNNLVMARAPYTGSRREQRGAPAINNLMGSMPGSMGEVALAMSSNAKTVNVRNS